MNAPPEWHKAEMAAAAGAKTEPSSIYSSREAAEYLGISFRTIRKHLYETKDLTPDTTIAGRLIFTKANLDAFNARRRPGGRPRLP